MSKNWFTQLCAAGVVLGTFACKNNNSVVSPQIPQSSTPVSSSAIAPTPTPTPVPSSSSVIPTPTPVPSSSSVVINPTPSSSTPVVAGQYRDRTRLIGYYPNYAQTMPTVAQAQKLSHLMYFSIPLTPGTTMGAIDSKNYLGNIRVKAIIDTAKKGGAKAVAVFGGAGISLSEFAQTAANPAARAIFAHNCADFVKQMNMDGVDIDWEFPNFPAAYNNYVALLKTLKDTLAVYSVAMGKTLELSTAVHPDHASHFDANLGNAVDYINIMTYDLGVPHAPANAAQVYLNAFAARGIPKSKLAIGVPFYGKVGNDGPSALSWSKLVNAGCDVTLDQCAVASAGGKVYDFNGTATIANKAKYSLDNGFGGVLIWDISMDLAPSDPRSLLNVLSQVQ